MRDAVSALGMSDHVTFKAVDIEKDILRGICYRYLYTPAPYAPQEARVDILYASSLDRAWQRLVITKELVNTLDNGRHSTSTEEAVEDLIARMSRRPELREPMTWAEATDRVALFQALGILFPWSARQLLVEKYRDGLISDEMIGHRAAIPDVFIGYLMSSDWDSSYHDFMRLCEAGQDEAA